MVRPCRLRWTTTYFLKSRKISRSPMRTFRKHMLLFKRSKTWNRKHISISCRNDRPWVHLSKRRRVIQTRVASNSWQKGSKRLEVCALLKRTTSTSRGKRFSRAILRKRKPLAAQLETRTWDSRYGMSTRLIPYRVSISQTKSELGELLISLINQMKAIAI